MVLELNGSLPGLREAKSRREPWSRTSIARATLVLVFLTVAGSVLVLGARSDWGRRLEAGERVPQFSVRLDDGRTASSRSLLGRRYLIAFFRPDCDACRSELPWIAKASPPDGMPVLFAVSSGSAAATARFWKELSLSLPTAVDPDRVVLKAFQVRSVPTLISVGRDGRIDEIQSGLGSRVELARMLRVIGARPFEGPQRSANGSSIRDAKEEPCSTSPTFRGSETPCRLLARDGRAEARIAREGR